MAAPTVYLLDDDPSVLKGLERLVRSAGYRTVPFSSPREFSLNREWRRPGCIILDVQMPGLTGLEVYERYLKKKIPLPVIFVTGHGDIPMGVKAIREGAFDFIVKPYDAKKLLETVEEALRKNKVWARTENLFDSLSSREREVFYWVLKGLLNKQIASKLSISEKTVKVHRARVMEKMKVRSVAELAQAASKLDLLD
jgi:FixJ family two-component response regulator